MVHIFSYTLIATFIAAYYVSCESCSTLNPRYNAPVAADGWTYQVIADDFTRPRGLLVDARGGLLVVDATVGIIHLTIEDTGGGCLTTSKKKSIIQSRDLNHGIAMSVDGKTLYASSSDKVFSWGYDAANGTVDSSNKTVVTNMANPGHTTRTLLVPQKAPGMLVISRGSDSNEDASAEDINSGHCQIRAFDIEALGDRLDPYDFSAEGTLLGWGLRNSVGVAEEPVTGGIWSVENSADNLSRQGSDIHQDNPGEELNFHGFLNGSLEGQGENYGYPRCYAIWSTTNFPGRGELVTGDQFSVAQTDEVNDSSCRTNYTSPRLTFQAHTAPLDLKFMSDGSQALVTFHGSWNRAEPVGYKLSSIAFNNGSPVEPATSVNAARDILSNADLSMCPERCFRPVGLAWGSDGHLFMSSDSTGEIYVLRRTGVSEGGVGDADSHAPERFCALRIAVLAAATTVVLLFQ